MCVYLFTFLCASRVTIFHPFLLLIAYGGRAHWQKTRSSQQKLFSDLP